MGLALFWTIAPVIAYSWWDITFRPAMTPYCAYFMDEHPVGHDATLDEGALSTVMHCRLDQMRYGQYGDKAWHVRACSAGDIAYSTAHPKETVWCK